MAEPERIDDDGKLFWKFPALPYNVGEEVRTIYDWYMRTSPETGAEVDLSQWATYPNNATANKLLPLLETLDKISSQAKEKIDASPNMGWFLENPRMRDEIDLFRTRLGAYKATLGQLITQGHGDVMVGTTDNAAAELLSAQVVEPLFLGWYPNAVWPFSEMGPPYSEQTEQTVMDLYLPFSIANQAQISNAALSEAVAQLRKDLRDRFNATIPVIPALSMLPFILALAAGVAAFTWLRKD